MKILGREVNLFGKKEIPQEIHIDGPQVKRGVAPEANLYQWQNIITDTMIYDGEKTPYELGRAFEFKLDYYTLRARSWEAFLSSDVIQNAINKYCLWIVGAGLKFQSDPVESILKDYGLIIDAEEFSQNLENQFRLYLGSKVCSYSKMKNFHKIAKEALKNAIVAGDVLCVARTDGKIETIEIIDGYSVQTPIGTDDIDNAIKRGNKIIDGVEVDKSGKHVAYYIYQSVLKYKRIRARGAKTGRLQAWLMYGSTFKINDTRGMSLFGAVLETAAKMDRYKDATIGAAEENAKIPYTIEHESYSTGEHPMQDQTVQAFGKDKPVAPETKGYDTCNDKASKIAQTTGKTVYNMPLGSKFSRHGGSSDVNFAGFFDKNIDIVYATIGIPPEVAMDKFGGSYSGSRAALKSWEYKMAVDRALILSEDLYGPFFNFWFDLSVLRGNVQAPGYLQALLVDANIYVIEAYRKSEYIGAGVPHIDPEKEVKAERLKLGPLYDRIPLTSQDLSMKTLNTGDPSILAKKVPNELKLFENEENNDTAGGDTGDTE